MHPGFFVVLEGPEGSGKSTLARGVADLLRAHRVDPIVVREPGGTPAAEALRAELLDADRSWRPEAELLYMVTARADLVAKVIRPALEGGRLVLSDRFEMSTRAYQGAGRGVPLDYLEWTNRAATGGLVPDLTVVLDIPPELGLTRMRTSGRTHDRLDRESLEFHRRVGAYYRQAEGPGVWHVDATLAPAELVRAVLWRMHQQRPDLVPEG